MFKEPAVQEAHKDFSAHRLANMEKKLKTHIPTMTLLLGIDHGSSVLLYHPDKQLRQVEPPVRILLPNAGGWPYV